MMRHPLVQTSFVLFSAFFYACSGERAESFPLPSDGYYQTGIALGLRHPTERHPAWLPDQQLVGTGNIELDWENGTLMVRMARCDFARKGRCEPVPCDEVSLPVFPEDSTSFGPITSLQWCDDGVVMPAPTLFAQLMSEQGVRFDIERKMTFKAYDSYPDWGSYWNARRPIPTAEELDVNWQEVP